MASEPSYTFRLVTGFVGQILVLIAVPSFYFLHLPEDVHFTIVLVATAIAAIVTGTAISTYFVAHIYVFFLLLFICTLHIMPIFISVIQT